MAVGPGPRFRIQPVPTHSVQQQAQSLRVNTASLLACTALTARKRTENMSAISLIAPSAAPCTPHAAPAASSPTAGEPKATLFNPAAMSFITTTKDALLSKWDGQGFNELMLKGLQATWEEDLTVPPLPTATELERAVGELKDADKRSKTLATFNRLSSYKLRYVNLGDPGCLRHLCGQAQVLCFACQSIFSPIDTGKVKQHEKSKKHVMGMMAYHAATKAGHEANFRAQQSMSPAVAQLY
ncbi:MAG: hypothetical protein EOO65_01310, partial [Methanosarcinales archaeon]